mgnify:CR=1 FL=1
MRAVNGLRERFASQAVILSEFTAASMPEKHTQRRISAVRNRSRQDSSLVAPRRKLHLYDPLLSTYPLSP